MKHRLTCLRWDRRGIIALEFAIIFPVLIYGVLLAFDAGIWAVQQQIAFAGVQAGGTYAQQHADATAETIKTVIKQSNAMLAQTAPVVTTSGSNWAISVTVPYIGLGLGSFFSPIVVATYVVPQHA